MLTSPRAPASRPCGRALLLTISSRGIGSNRGRASFRGAEHTTAKKKKKERGCISWSMSSGAATPAAGAANMAAVISGSIAVPKHAPLEAVLFDIDGTLCDSDPIHFRAFRELLQQVGFNGGVPITEEFYSANISGGHNDDLARALFPDTDFDKAMKFMDDKEALFRKLAPEELEPVAGLRDLCRWIEGRGLKRAAVTNAPRPNAELMLSLLGLTDFFPVLVIGTRERVRSGQAVPRPVPRGARTRRRLAGTHRHIRGLCVGRARRRGRGSGGGRARDEEPREGAERRGGELARQGFPGPEPLVRASGAPARRRRSGGGGSTRLK